jgi:hypothetical protein
MPDQRRHAKARVKVHCRKFSEIRSSDVDFGKALAGCDVHMKDFRVFHCRLTRVILSGAKGFARESLGGVERSHVCLRCRRA